MDELIEFRELVSSIRSDRLAQKEKEARESWTKYVSLSTIFLAVLSAYAGAKGGGFSSRVMKQLNEGTFNTAKASDQWALYQAKGIKQTLAEGELDTLKVGAGPDRPRIAELSAKSKRYDNEKKEVAKIATAFEAKSEEARNEAARASVLGGKMGVSTILFQLAISLGAVCLIMKKRWLWGVSMGLGILAAVQMARVLMSG